MEERRATFGVLVATMINAAPFRGEGKAVSPYDIYPDPDAQAQRQSPEEQEALLRGFFSRFKKKN
jgi:hypothetical protein